jgi:hypothetical protein
MFGINCGDSLVPYLAARAWELNHNRPSTLIHFMFGCMFLPFVLAQFAQRLSYNHDMSDFEGRREMTTFYYEAVATFVKNARRVSVNATRRFSKVIGITVTPDEESGYGSLKS